MSIEYVSIDHHEHYQQCHHHDDYDHVGETVRKIGQTVHPCLQSLPRGRISDEPQSHLCQNHLSYIALVMCVECSSQVHSSHFFTSISEVLPSGMRAKER